MPRDTFGIRPVELGLRQVATKNTVRLRRLPVGVGHRGAAILAFYPRGN